MADRISADLIVKAIFENGGKVVGDIKKIEKAIDDVTKKGGQSGSGGGSPLAGLDKSFSGLSKSILGANVNVGSLIATIGKLGAAGAIIGAVGAAIKKSFDLGREGAMLQRLEDAGESLAASLGSSMDAIVGKIQDASLGTVSKLDIIASANRAMMLGLSADAEKLAALMEVAAFKGRAMGVSTTQAFNDIVTGIGRMSPLILDNLGIIINLDERVREYAEANHVAADAIDETTKRQILLNAVLTEGQKQIQSAGGLNEDAASGFERLGAEVKNFTDSVKQSLAPITSDMASYLADAVAFYRELIFETKNAHDQIVAVGTIPISYDIEGMKKRLEQGLPVPFTPDPGAVQAETEEVKKNTSAWTENQVKQREQANAKARLIAAGEELKKQQEEETKALEEQAKALEAARKEAEAYAASLQAVGRAGNVNLNITSNAASLIDEIDYILGGGRGIQQRFLQAQRNYDIGAIDEEAYRAQLRDIATANEGMLTAIGQQTKGQGAQNIKNLYPPELVPAAMQAYYASVEAALVSQGKKTMEQARQALLANFKDLDEQEVNALLTEAMGDLSEVTADVEVKTDEAVQKSEQAATDINEQNKAIQEGTEGASDAVEGLSEDVQEESKDTKEAVGEIKTEFVELKDAIESASKEWARMVSDIIKGGAVSVSQVLALQNAIDALEGKEIDIIVNILYNSSGAPPPGGGVFTAGSGGGGVFDYQRAGGGHYGAGDVALVGEEGPELFVSSTSGTIYPNSVLSTVGTSPAAFLTTAGAPNAGGGALNQRSSVVYFQIRDTAAYEYAKADLRQRRLADFNNEMGG